MSYASNVLFPRRIVIDDTDPRVKYETGSWSLDDTGTFDSLSSFGGAYNRTMHGSNENSASFSFTFEGGYVSVWGAKDTRNIQQNGAGQDDLTKLAQWRCQVDGTPIQRVNYLTSVDRVTNNLLCETNGLSTSTHVLTLNVTIEDPQTQMFWLDKIEYTPGPNVDLAGEVMKFDSSDVNVRYDNNSGSWIPDSGTSSAGPLFNQTVATGASLSFIFNGTSVSLYGFLEGDTPRAPSSGRYYIDGVNDTTFVNPGSRPLPSNGTGDHYNEFLFKSQDLEPGTHDMTVMFTGVRAAEGETPIQWLAIDYFYVTASEGDKSGANQGTDSGGNGSGNGTQSDSGLGSSPRKKPVGAIVGGVVGGVAVLALLGLVILLLRKQRQRKRGAANTGPDRYMEPAVYTPESPSSRFHSQPYTATSLYDPKLPNDSIPLLTPDRSAKDRVGIPSSVPVDGSTYGSSLQDIEDAALAQNSFERRHQDSGIRFPQNAQRIVDVPPDYTVQ